MNKLLLYSGLFFMVLLANCGGSDESKSEYEKLLQTSDTLQKRNSNLASSLDTLTTTHNDLFQQLQSMDSLDTAWLEMLARHEVAVKNQKATFDKNTKVFEGHNEFRNKRDQVTDEEFKAQISEMKQGHSEIKTQLDQAKTQMQSMSDDHSKIKKELNDMMKEDM